MKIARPFDAFVNTSIDLFASCKIVLVTPSDPEILTIQDANGHYRKINRSVTHCLMTLKLTHSTTREMVRDARRASIVGFVLYPEGIVENGIKSIPALFPIFEEMESCGLVLQIHCENPSFPHLRREIEYLDKVASIIKNFPGMRVVIEHVSSSETVEFIKGSSVNVVGTITAHHLCLTNDDLYGRDYNYCLPIPKFEEDRRALVNAAMFSNQFFFGSDSSEKEILCPPELSIPILAEKMELSTSNLSRFNNFISHLGTKFYRLPQTTETIELREEEWQIPEKTRHFRAGETLKWRLDT